MRFKEWYVATVGGGEDYPGQNLNTNMPVRSRYATQDGAGSTPLDAADGARKPEKTFGFGVTTDQKSAKERRRAWIDKGMRGNRFVTIPSDTVL
jgi:hypothetical protein